MIIRRDDHVGQAVALLIGAVIGGAMGEVFRPYVPILGSGVVIGFKPVTVDLHVITLTLGMMFKVTISAVIGILLAFLLILKK